MPTVPSSAAVLRTRYAITVGANILALTLFAAWASYALVLLVHHYFFGPSPALIRAGFVVPEPVLDRIVLAGVPVVTAGLLAVVVPRLLVVLAPLPREGCPFCRHPSLPETGPRCTECGRELPAQLLAPQTD